MSVGRYLLFPDQARFWSFNAITVECHLEPKTDTSFRLHRRNSRDGCRVSTH